MITLTFYIVPNLIDDVLIIDTTNFLKIVRSSYYSWLESCLAMKRRESNFVYVRTKPPLMIQFSK